MPKTPDNLDEQYADQFHESMTNALDLLSEIDREGFEISRQRAFDLALRLVQQAFIGLNAVVGLNPPPLPNVDDEPPHSELLES